MSQEPPCQEQIVLDIGRVIYECRKDLGLSQEKFAELANCHRNNIGLLERGESNTSIEMLHSVAQAIGISVSELLRKAGY